MDTTKEIAISNLLKDLGVTPGLLGYTYLKTAIGLQMEDPTYKISIVYKLYPEVARIHGTTPSRVERAIRHAIEKGWTLGCASVQNDLFRYTIDESRGKPTNGEFMATVSDYLQMTL